MPVLSKFFERKFEKERKLIRFKSVSDIPRLDPFKVKVTG